MAKEKAPRMSWFVVFLRTAAIFAVMVVLELKDASPGGLALAMILGAICAASSWTLAEFIENARRGGTQ